MLAILDEHLLKFHACTDAKSLWEAIKNRFGGNKESKKMHKTILKQNYENFAASSQEGLDKTYDRFQKLISQLEIHGEVISQEDANQKLLRSLPSAWNNIALIMRNKSDLDTLSMDDLYNNLKSSEDEVADDAEKKSTEVLRKENEVQDLAKEGDKNDQEKYVRDQEEALRKQFKQESERLFGQWEAANTNSTNRLNIISSPVNAVFTIVDPGRERTQRNEFESMFGQDKDANGDMMFTPVSAAGSTYVYLGGLIPINAATLLKADLSTDPLMPDLEDTQDWLHKVTPKKKALIMMMFLPLLLELKQSVKTANTPIETNKALLKDEEVEDVDEFGVKTGSCKVNTARRKDNTAEGDKCKYNGFFAIGFAINSIKSFSSTR
nr:ribonuclease H-like domain-containing protein [Tanacetum cinerariifolium]